MNDYKETQEKKSGQGKKILIALLVIVVVAVLAFLGWNSLSGETTSTDTDSTTVANADSALKVGDSKTYQSDSADGTLSSVEIAAKVKPSVIAVMVYQNGEQAGEGSGVVMSTDEDNNCQYILTCAHIISTSGCTYAVQLEDGTSYDAEVVGYDSRTDVGLLRIEGTELTPAEFGDSTVLQVGEPVYAIGNPGGTEFYGSFTAGVVSAIDRPTAASDSGYTMECIQHDAAINPGNSGGALVNSYGQVIGINSSKIADEEYEGMGFAIPIAVAQDVVADLMSDGYVKDRAKLGIQYIAASSNTTYSMICQMNDLPSGSVVIAEISEDGSLAGTKAQAGDLIIAANGDEMTSTSVLLGLVEKAKPGDKLTLTIAHVAEDYSVSTFDIEVTLVEDKGTTAETTTESSDQSSGFVNPFAQN